MSRSRCLRSWGIRAACFVLALCAPAWVLSDPSPAPRADRHPRSRSRLSRLARHVGKILREGDPEAYVSGYAYHSRRRYSPDLLRIMNENAWGGGFGSSLSMHDGGVSSLAFTAFQDSLGQWEYNLGYLREWRTRPGPGRLVFGAGLAGFLTSRQDFFEGTPFPAVLPIVSLEASNVTLLATLVPRLPSDTEAGRRGEEINGDVAYVFARIKLR